MNQTRTIGWSGISRKAIPGVMLGMEEVPMPLALDPRAAMTPSADLVVAFFMDEPASDRLPCLAVIPDSKLPDVLSWIHTFSPETFPLSQYCRVLRESDWERMENFDGGDWTLTQRYRWSSVIAGEMLAQAEASVSPAVVPLAWAQGCLSLAVARAAMIYGGASASSLVQVSQRLLHCTGNPAFQRKRIDQAILSPIWKRIEEPLQQFQGQRAEVALGLVQDIEPILGQAMRSNKLLASSSAEERVHGFDQAVDQAISLKFPTREQHIATGATLASAAYLVGTGTSHIELLEPYAQAWPDAYVWFGLLAGVAGPASWDPHWMRLVKGVDRVLSAGHALTDAPQVDLSWVEFDWLSRISGQGSEYTQLPKQHPRALSVEVLPGIPCQFRLTGGAPSKSDRALVEARVEKREAPQPAPVTSAMNGALSQDKLNSLARLLTQAQEILAPAAKAQPDMFDGPNVEMAATRKRAPAKKTGKMGFNLGKQKK